MRYSKDHKADTHARIVKNASIRLREKGPAGIGVAELMKESGLTHGGFYAHFDSRDALIDEAFAHAMEGVAHAVKRYRQKDRHEAADDAQYSETTPAGRGRSGKVGRNPKQRPESDKPAIDAIGNDRGEQRVGEGTRLELHLAVEHFHRKEGGSHGRAKNSGKACRHSGHTGGSARTDLQRSAAQPVGANPRRVPEKRRVDSLTEAA